MSSHLFCGPFVIQTTLPSRKFHPKKSPVRRVNSMTSLYLLNHRSRLHELGLDYGNPEVQLDNKTYVFRNGTWVLAGCTHTESQTKTSFKKLSARNKILTEENNYLKLQLDVLLDMLAEATARLQAAEDKVTRKLSADKKCVLMIQSDDCSS